MQGEANAMLVGRTRAPWANGVHPGLGRERLGSASRPSSSDEVRNSKLSASIFTILFLMLEI